MAYPTTSTPAIRTIHKEHQHLSWDNSRPPALTVAPGETVGFKDIDGTLGQLTQGSTARDVGNLDLSRLMPNAADAFAASPFTPQELQCASPPRAKQRLADQ